LIAEFNDFTSGGIVSFCVTSNQEYLFTGDDKGNLIQCPITDTCEKDVKFYDSLHKSQINCIQASPDSKFLFTTDNKGLIMQFSLTPEGNLEKIKEFPNTYDSPIISMVITHRGSYLFSADAKGNLQQWSISKSKLHKNWGQIHAGQVTPNPLFFPKNFLGKLSLDQFV
jgi:WD40 repeat protein